MTTNTSRRAREISTTSLWFGMLGSAVVWFAYLGLVWAFVEFGCRLDLINYSLVGLPAIDALVIGATIPALILSAASTAIAVRNWRAIDDERPPREDRIGQRTRFMSKVGTLMGGLFTLVIVVTFIPLLILPTCGGILG